MSALDALKKQSNISNILKQVEKTSGKSSTKSYVDDRYWKITRDESGNGTAIIRFLPAPQGEPSPFAHVHKYKFKYPPKTGKMYWNNSLYTLGQVDPCYVAWKNLKDSSNPEDKLRAAAIQRAEDFTSNILVISDPANPENNGKVFLFEYGKQIYKMIMDKISPEFDDETPVNIFDPFEGANFKLRTNIGETKLPTYAKSVFDSPSRLADTDDEIVEIWNKCYPLAEISAPDKFKTYEQLETELNAVLYGTPTSKPAQRPTAASLPEDDLPTFPSSGPTLDLLKSSTPTTASNDVDDDAEMSYFQNLANSD